MLRRVAVPLLILLCIAARAQTRVPLITSVTPESGAVGTEITIAGENFGTDPLAAIVTFGAVRAVVTQVSPTSIKTRVPAGATYKPVSVLVNKLTGFSPKPFIVTSSNETLINTMSFSDMVSFEVGGAPYEVAVADLDVDGKPDLIVAGYSTISVLRNTSVKGNFTPASFGAKVDIVTTGIAAASLATGDFDGDGKIDIVAVSALGNTNSVTVIKNNSVPGFINATSFDRYVFAVGPNPQKVAVADIDKDGKPDVITANGNNSISILHASVDEFGVAFEIPITVNLTTPGTAETVTAADMDLDGKPDLVEYNFSNNQYTISVSRNLSEPGIITQGSFALAVSYGSGAISDSDIAIGDLDNDGRPDILANFGTNNTISVLRNLTVPGNFNSASFASKVDFGTGTNPLCGKAIADLNGDRLPDIISTNRESNSWSAFQNRILPGIINTASFLPKVDFNTGLKPTGIAAADFDGDGMTDVVVVSRESRTASIYRNRMADAQVLAYSPKSGKPGDTLNITGVNFGSDPSAITIRVNGTKATIVGTTTTSVKAVIPAEATTGALTVTKNGATTKADGEITILPVKIESFSPATAFVGEQVIINGNGFSSEPSNNEVKIAGVHAGVSSSNSREIRITVPDGAITGKITVTTNNTAIATSNSDLVITPVTITETTFPDLYTVGEEEVIATISYTHVQQVSAIHFMSRGITVAGDFRGDEIEVSPSGQVSFTIPSAYFDDPIGLQMKFTITDVDGNEIFREGFAYKKYLANDASQNLPGLSFGSGVENYHLISFPLDIASRSVTSVFRELGDFDAKRWRVFAFDQQLQELRSRNSSISPGAGYWFITRDEVVINPGEGTTVHANASQPYVLTLKPGWNLIGNPYNFTLSWKDVLDYNNNPLSIGTLRQFQAGKMSINNSLSRFRGAFVRNDSTANVALKIPVTNSSASGRKGTEPDDPRNWEIILTVSDGTLSNSLGGFGMNIAASESNDRLDEVALPLPVSMSSFELIMRNAHEGIVKDIVPATDSYTWTGAISNSNDVTLSWDNLASQELPYELWMELPGHPSLVDMRSASHINFPIGHHSFRIVYGSRDYIARATETLEIVVGDVATNPLMKQSGVLAIPVNLPSETNTIQLEMIDTKGVKVCNSFAGNYTRGRNVVEWTNDFSQLSPGLYLLSITIAASDSSRTFYRKFVLE